MFKIKTKNYKIFKKATKLSSIIFLVTFVVFVILEPVVINAVADSATATATVTSEVTISSPSNATFSASIPGVSGNPGSPATATLAWTVITNNSGGFDLTLQASQTNALYKDGSYYFTDYGTPPNPTFGWTAPSVGTATFGFTIAAATAADTATAFKDGGAACGAGDNTGGCWAGFNGTTPITVVHRTSSTDASGQAEVVNFRAESNAKFLESGNYTATITATTSLN